MSNEFIDMNNIDELLNPFELTQNDYLDGDTDVTNNSLNNKKAIFNLLNGSAKGTLEKYFLDPIPFYNRIGECYSYLVSNILNSARTDSIKMNRENMDYTNNSGHGLNLLMPQYKRRVEVEDLDENFWVIGNLLDAVLSAIWKDNGIIDLLKVLSLNINTIMDYLGLFNVQKLSLMYNKEEDTTVDMYSRFSLSNLSLKISTTKGERIIDDIFRQHNKNSVFSENFLSAVENERKFLDYILDLNTQINNDQQEYIYDSSIISKTTKNSEGQYLSKILSKEINDINTNSQDNIPDNTNIETVAQYTLLQDGDVISVSFRKEIEKYVQDYIEVKENKEDFLKTITVQEESFDYIVRIKTARFLAMISSLLMHSGRTDVQDFLNLFDENGDGTFNNIDMQIYTYRASLSETEYFIFNIKAENKASFDKICEEFNLANRFYIDSTTISYPIKVPNARYLATLENSRVNSEIYSLEKSIYLFLYDKNRYEYISDNSSYGIVPTSVSENTNSTVSIDLFQTIDLPAETLVYPDIKIIRQDNIIPNYYCIFIPRSDLINGEIIQLHLNPKELDESTIRYGLYNYNEGSFTKLSVDNVETKRYPFLSLYNSFSDNKKQYNYRTTLFFKDVSASFMESFMENNETEDSIKACLSDGNNKFQKNYFFQTGINASYFLPYKNNNGQYFEKKNKLRIKASMFASHYPIIDNTYYYNSIYMRGQFVSGELKYPLVSDDMRIKRQQLYSAAIRNNLVFYGTPALRMNNQFYHSSLQALQSETIRGNSETMQRGSSREQISLQTCFKWPNVSADQVIGQIVNNNIEPSLTRSHLEFWFGRRENENYTKKKKIKYIIFEREDGSRHSTNAPQKAEIYLSNGYIEKQPLSLIENEKYEYEINWISNDKGEDIFGYIKLDDISQKSFDNIMIRLLRKDKDDNAVIAKMFYAFGEDEY